MRITKTQATRFQRETDSFGEPVEELIQPLLAWLGAENTANNREAAMKAILRSQERKAELDAIWNWLKD